MDALGAWTPLMLLLVILCYWIAAVALLLAPMVAPLVREAWQARRARREPTFVLFRPYPSYLLHFRRIVLLCLVAPPALLAGAWLGARMLMGSSEH
jgi:hypothetical protein